MNDKVKTALESTGFVAEDIHQLTAGSYNKVFEVNLENNQKAVVRVFRSKGWPEEGKLDWISDKLSSLNIPTAKILYSTRTDKYFPNGFMVQEFIDGEIVQKVAGIDITYGEYYKELAKIMRQIHQINLPKFGYIGQGTGNHDSLESYLLRDIDKFFDRNQQISDQIAVSKDDFKKVVVDKLKDIFHLPSVLTHNDLSPNNVMLRKDNQLVIIDWDNAVSHVWLNDFAVMTYWMRNRHKDEKEREEYIRIFLENYQSEINLEKIRELEKTLHLIQAVNLLGYYSSDDKDRKSFEDTLNYFNQLKQEMS